MSLSFLNGLKLNGRNFILGVINRLTTRQGFPICHGLLAGNDLNFLALKFKETHPAAEALLVKFAQRHLITMITRRPKNLAVGAAAGDASVIPLRWFRLNHFFAIKSIPQCAEGAPFQNFGVKPNRPILQLMQRMCRITAGNAHHMALRLFQKHPSSSK